MSEPAVPYRPSNGSEGECFFEQWCSRCWRDAAHRDDPDAGYGCEIIVQTMILDVDDPGYPKEWIKDATGPRCTAFAENQEDGTIHDARQEGLL